MRREDGPEPVRRTTGQGMLLTSNSTRWPTRWIVSISLTITYRVTCDKEVTGSLYLEGLANPPVPSVAFV